MAKAAREFQVFVKPIGSICNLACHYCYYLVKDQLYPKRESFRMSDDILEEYIAQHIAAYPELEIRFSWHGGEPTLLGLDYFRKIISLQQKHKSPGQLIRNGIQTNGTLLDEEWCRFFSNEKFVVGLSLDGPRELHDLYRLTKDQKSAFEQTMCGYKLLRQHNIDCDILCVVNAENVKFPIRAYRFFKELKVPYITFLPLVEPDPGASSGLSSRSVTPKAWGEFLCTIFDEWIDQDIGRIKIQIFEEATRVAFNQEHSLCIFRPICGDIPVIEHNGDFYSCDHFVDENHNLGNIQEIPLVKLLESSKQRAFGQAKLKTLPKYCLECEVRHMCNGECPKNRIIKTPDGEKGLNYLCAGYKWFFKHCQPFVAEVAEQWHRQNLDQETLPGKLSEIRSDAKIGRNDPCPCGSGMKYKKCCYGKQ